MFLGTYTPKLDDKGRLTLPAKFRDALAGGLMVTKSQDHSLAVYPRDADTPDGLIHHADQELYRSKRRSLATVQAHVHDGAGARGRRRGVRSRPGGPARGRGRVRSAVVACPPGAARTVAPFPVGDGD